MRFQTLINTMISFFCIGAVAEEFPAITTYSKPGCHGQDQIYDHKHTLHEDECVINHADGIQSIQVYVAPEMTPWKCYLYTHFTPDCAGTLTIETLMSHDNGGFTCQDSVWGGGIHSFSYQCEGISP